VGIGLGGCTIVDPDFIDSLPPGPVDAGDDDDDMGDDDDDLVPADECGRPDTPTLPRVPAQTVDVDTRDFTDETRLSCSGIGGTVGADAFFAIDVEPRDFWHFHLTPRDEGEARDAVLYLLQASGSVCNTRSCQQLSNRCVNFGAEHFGFRAGPNDRGRFYLGIDDLVPGGGVYELEVFRPECGNDDAEHGEGCDGDERCDAFCRTSLTGPVADEAGAVPPNTPDEAFTLVLPPGGGSIVVRGNADNDTSDGADECDYPDYFAVNVPQGGTVEAVIVDRAGADCDAPGDVDNVSFELQTRTLTRVAVSTPAAGSGCPELRAEDLDEGQYLLLVTQVDELPLAELGYEVKVAVEEP